MTGKKNLSKYIPVLICIVFGVIFSLFFLLNKSLDSENAGDLQTELQFDPYQTSIAINNQMAGTFAPDVLCNTDKNVELNLGELVNNGEKVLIFRYADVNCNICYVSELAILNEVFPEEEKNVIVLCSYFNHRDYVVFKKMNKIKFSIYRVAHDAFNWEMEYYSAPYFFLLHPDLSISNIYMPDKSFPDLSRKYLNNIKKILSRKQ